jgi:hypothetical protein
MEEPVALEVPVIWQVRPDTPVGTADLSPLAEALLGARRRDLEADAVAKVAGTGEARAYSGSPQLKSRWDPRLHSCQSKGKSLSLRRRLS